MMTMINSHFQPLIIPRGYLYADNPFLYFSFFAAFRLSKIFFYDVEKTLVSTESADGVGLYLGQLVHSDEYQSEEFYA